PGQQPSAQPFRPRCRTLTTRNWSRCRWRPDRGCRRVRRCTRRAGRYACEAARRTHTAGRVWPFAWRAGARTWHLSGRRQDDPLAGARALPHPLRTGGAAMTLVTTPCSERIAPATLAAWHDGPLPDAEAARVAAHVPTCRACHAELAAYETLDAALRRHPALEPDGRLWHAVRAAMTGRRRMQYTDTSVRRLTGSLIPLAA